MSTQDPRASFRQAHAQIAAADAPIFEKSVDTGPLLLPSGLVANPILARQLANAQQALATFLDAPALEKSLTEEEFVAQHANDLIFDDAGLQRFSDAMLEKGMSDGLAFDAIEATLVKAREGLVKKTITTKSGHTATRWVKAGGKAAPATSGAKPAKASSAALHHKLLANHHGRRGDHFSDEAERLDADAKAAPNKTVRTGYELGRDQAKAKAKEHYAKEKHHVERREKHGGHLGGQQSTAELASAYAAHHDTDEFESGGPSYADHRNQEHYHAQERDKAQGEAADSRRLADTLPQGSKGRRDYEDKAKAHQSRADAHDAKSMHHHKAAKPLHDKAAHGSWSDHREDYSAGKKLAEAAD